MSDDYKPVTFLNSAGEEISNDPVWHAQKTLRDAGIPFTQSQPEVAQQKLADDSNDELDTKDEADKPRDYKEVQGKDLSALAKERGVELTEGIKAGEVRAALIKQDVEAAAEAEVNKANDPANQSQE